jgi:excisionase family DNA binding protein
MTDENTYMTVSVVAEILQVSKTQVYRMMHDGVIPHIKISPRGYRILREPFILWLKGGLLNEKE